MKLIKGPILYDHYYVFMREYDSFEHMKVASHSGKYIISHHDVVKRDENKLKIYVVFTHL